MNSKKSYIRKDANFSIYGLGSTGKSVINALQKFKIKKFQYWDDSKKKRLSIRIKNKKNTEKNFYDNLDKSDFIVISPGININNSKFKKKLQKNKKKIITDIDLLYLLNKDLKTIVITGTNGKSTVCKIIEHVLNKNKINAVAGGNIGKPVLNLNYKKNSYLIIEASSFQLAYSKFIRPNFAIILNVVKDHIDWHGNFRNYLNSKFRIFVNQGSKDKAMLENKSLIKKFKNENFKGKLKLVNIKKYLKIKEKIKNVYLKSKVSDQNMSFVSELSRLLKIKNSSLIKSLNSYKGLPHRQEIFYRKKNLIFINDSKATSFAATKFALSNKRNVLWIVGGMPKIGDKFKLGSIKKNILKAYIVGNYINFFQKQLKGKIEIQTCKKIDHAIVSIFRDLKKINDEKQITILLSPASASYDQYKNFEERGFQFKKKIKLYAKKYI